MLQDCIPIQDLLNLIEVTHILLMMTTSLVLIVVRGIKKAAKLLTPADWHEVTLEEAEKTVEGYRKFLGREITLEDAQEVLRAKKLQSDVSFAENGKSINMKVEGTHLILVSRSDYNFAHLIEPQMKKLSQLDPQLKELTNNLLLLPCTATLDILNHLPVKEAISMAIVNKKRGLPWQFI